MAPHYDEDPVITPGRITVKYVKANPAITNLFSVPTHNLPRYNEYFVLSLAVSKSDMMIQMVDKPNTTPDHHLLIPWNKTYSSSDGEKDKTLLQYKYSKNRYEPLNRNIPKLKCLHFGGKHHQNLCHPEIAKDRHKMLHGFWKYINFFINHQLKINITAKLTHQSKIIKFFFLAGRVADVWVGILGEFSCLNWSTVAPRYNEVSRYQKNVHYSGVFIIAKALL